MKLTGRKTPDRGEPGAEKEADGVLNAEAIKRAEAGENEEPGGLLKPSWIKDYRSFATLLHEHDVPYLADSGVLLGLMREGRLLNHEKDIDLQMWAEDEESLLKLLPFAWQQGYTVTIWLYRGRVIQYRFLREDQLPVHIMLFRRSGSIAWCPAGEGTGPPYPVFLTRHFYHYFVVARKKWRERVIATEVTRWPWKARRRVGTWWVPARFFEQRVYHPLFGVYIPGEWENYLAYRYGNWRVPPERKWDIWRDDGALQLKRPEKLVDFSRYNSWDGARLLKETRKKAREEQ